MTKQKGQTKTQEKADFEESSSLDSSVISEKADVNAKIIEIQYTDSETENNDVAMKNPSTSNESKVSEKESSSFVDTNKKKPNNNQNEVKEEQNNQESLKQKQTSPKQIEEQDHSVLIELDGEITKTIIGNASLLQKSTKNRKKEKSKYNKMISEGLSKKSQFELQKIFKRKSTISQKLPSINKNKLVGYNNSIDLEQKKRQLPILEIRKRHSVQKPNRFVVLGSPLKNKKKNSEKDISSNSDNQENEKSPLQYNQEGKTVSILKKDTYEKRRIFTNSQISNTSHVEFMENQSQELQKIQEKRELVKQKLEELRKDEQRKIATENKKKKSKRKEKKKFFKKKEKQTKSYYNVKQVRGKRMKNEIASLHVVSSSEESNSEDKVEDSSSFLYEEDSDNSDNQYRGSRKIKTNFHSQKITIPQHKEKKTRTQILQKAKSKNSSTMNIIKKAKFEKMKSIEKKSKGYKNKSKKQSVNQFELSDKEQESKYEQKYRENESNNLIQHKSIKVDYSPGKNSLTDVQTEMCTQWQQNYFKERQRDIFNYNQYRIAFVQAISFLGSILNAVGLTFLVVSEINTQSILSMFSLLFGIFGYITIYSEARKPKQQQKQSINKVMTNSCIFSFINILMIVTFYIKQQIFLYPIFFSQIPYLLEDYLLFQINRNQLEHEKLTNEIRELKQNEKKGIVQNYKSRRKKNYKKQQLQINEKIDFNIGIIQILSLLGSVYNFVIISLLLQEEWNASSLILILMLFLGIFLYISISAEARKPKQQRQSSIQKFQVCQGLFAILLLFAIVYYCMMQNQIDLILILVVTPYFIQDYQLNIISNDIKNLNQVNEDLEILEVQEMSSEQSPYSKISPSFFQGRKLMVKLNQRDSYFKTRKQEVEKILRAKIGIIQLLSFLGTLINTLNITKLLLKQHMGFDNISMIIILFLGICVYITIYSEVRKPPQFQTKIKDNSFQMSIMIFVIIKVVITGYYCYEVDSFVIELSIAIYPYLIQICFIFQVKRQYKIFSAIDDDIKQLKETNIIQSKIAKMQIQKKNMTQKYSNKMSKEDYFKSRKQQIEKGLNIKVGIVQLLCFIGSMGNSALVIILVIQEIFDIMKIALIGINFLGILVHISMYAKARNPYQIQQKTINCQITTVFVFVILNILIVLFYSFINQSLEFPLIFVLYPYLINTCILYQNKRDFIILFALLNDKKKFKSHNDDLNSLSFNIDDSQSNIDNKSNMQAIQVVQQTTNWKKNYFQEEERQLQRTIGVKVSWIQCISFISAVINVVIIISQIDENLAISQIITAFFHLFGIFLYISIFSSAVKPFQLQKSSGKNMIQYSLIFVFLNFLLFLIFKISEGKNIYILLMSPIPSLLQDWIYLLILNDIDSIDSIKFDLNRIKNPPKQEKIQGQQTTTLKIEKQKLANSQKIKQIRKELKSQICLIQCLTFFGGIYNFSVVIQLIVEYWDLATIIATMTNLIGIFVYITIYTEARRTEPVIRKTIQSTTYQILYFAMIYLIVLTFYGISKKEFNLVVNISFFPFLIIDCIFEQMRFQFKQLEKTIKKNKLLKQELKTEELIPLNSVERENNSFISDNI